jgi:cell wall-associated NlpC family hydrolase
MHFPKPGTAGEVLAGCVLLLGLCGCFRAARPAVPGSVPEATLPERERPLPRLGYTIQAGAFAQPENAARLSEKLQSLGMNAVYYAAAPETDPRRLYRVRFGDFPTREAALAKGVALRSAGVVEAFVIVAPEQPPLRRLTPTDEGALRADLVETASNYLGVPYLWGGASGAGFDCSGLTMAVYRLNGLQMPRSSREQFARGTPVPLSRIQKGDLLFFSTDGTGGVSHVGIYIGGDRFIHAPKHGRLISKATLEGYFRERLVGARSYLDSPAS